MKRFSGFLDLGRLSSVWLLFGEGGEKAWEISGCGLLLMLLW